MALSAEQRRIARIFAGELKRANAGKRVSKALYLAGLQESGLRNLGYGDKDSLGTLQERTSIYGKQHALDPAASARRFIHDAMKVNQGFKGSAGHLAQAVQRSAFPDAYDNHSATGDRLVRKFVGGATSPGGGSVTTGGQANPQSGQPAPPQVGDVGILTQLLQDQLSKPARPGSTTMPTPPSFAAGPTLARAPIQTQAPEPKKPDLSGTLAAVASVTGATLPASNTQAATGGGMPAGLPTGGNGGQGGRVTVAPGANRSGVKLHKDVVQFVKQVSAIDGRPLTIGTGTNHSQLTVNGTESDHWRGEGADVPLSGKALIRAGQAALIAAGMSEKRARKIRGGGFNVGGWQVIFNTNAPGWGDHTTHLHVGRRRS